jgi:hypothetical protein
LDKKYRERDVTDAEASFMDELQGLLGNALLHTEIFEPSPSIVFQCDAGLAMVLDIGRSRYRAANNGPKKLFFSRVV